MIPLPRYTEPLMEREEGRGAPHWQRLETAARQAIRMKGFPHRKLEAWRYTPLGGRMAEGGVLSTNATITDGGWTKNLQGTVLDLTAAGATLHGVIPGVIMEYGMADERVGMVQGAPSDGVVATNILAVQGVVVMDIAAGTVVEEPIIVRVHSQDSISAVHHTRMFLRVGAGAQVTVVEELLCSDPTQVQHHVVEIDCEEEATVEYYGVQSAEHVGVATAHRYFRVAAHGKGNYSTVNCGQGLVRNEGHVAVMGSGVEMGMWSLCVGRGTALLDTQLQVVHHVPHSDTEQTVRGIFDGQSKGVFQGRIYVAEGAHHTNAGQQSKQLLLSQEATVAVQPQLEIYNDDVRCAHGATTGFLDEEMLFYLRSRGISTGVAKRLLLEAFCDELLEKITVPSVRSWCKEHIHRVVTTPLS